MSVAGGLIARNRSRFDGFPEPLLEAYETSLRTLEPRLTPTQLEGWSRGGLDLMAISLRSWGVRRRVLQGRPSHGRVDPLGHL